MILEAELAAGIRAGMDALRTGRPAEAERQLRPAATHPVLSTQPDLADVYARVCSMLAQALLELGRAGEASRWIRAARESLGDTDPEGVAALRELERQAFSSAVSELQSRRERERIAATPVGDLLHGVDAPLARADVLLKKANAEIDADRAAHAVTLAEQALELARGADAVREEVLARMTVARAAPDRAQQELARAWRRAERADEFNLVGAVARAADLAGVPLPTLEGPAPGSPEAS